MGFQHYYIEPIKRFFLFIFELFLSRGDASGFRVSACANGVKRLQSFRRIDFRSGGKLDGDFVRHALFAARSCTLATMAAFDWG